MTQSYVLSQLIGFTLKITANLFRFFNDGLNEKLNDNFS